jgi:hypothetical protein
MAVPGGRLPVGLTARETHYDVAMPRFVLLENCRQYTATFLRIVASESEFPDGEPAITPAELMRIRDSTRIVVATVHCFSDVEVYPFEFPEYVCIPTDHIGPDVERKVVVLLYRFVCSTSHFVNCFIFGFVFADDMHLRCIAPQDSEVFIPPTSLRSVYQLVVALRQRAALATPEIAPEVLAESSAADVAMPDANSPPPPKTNGAVKADVATLRATAEVLLASAPAGDGVPGPYVFCSLNAFAPERVGESATVFRDQVVWRTQGRLLHYKFGGSVAETRKTAQNRVDCGVFWGATTNDLHHEAVVVLVMAMVFKRRADFFVDREMRLMRARISRKLGSKDARNTFLQANGLYETYVEHQATCEHAKFECFERFVLETYEATLARLARVTDYIMYDMPDDGASATTDEPALELLAQFADCAIKFMEIKF